MPLLTFAALERARRVELQRRALREGSKGRGAPPGADMSSRA
jgi:hypothetical protein